LVVGRSITSIPASQYRKCVSIVAWLAQIIEKSDASKSFLLIGYLGLG
jgi:hypothetical protein